MGYTFVIGHSGGGGGGGVLPPMLHAAQKLILFLIVRFILWTNKGKAIMSATGTATKEKSAGGGDFFWVGKIPAPPPPPPLCMKLPHPPPHYGLSATWFPSNRKKFPPPPHEKSLYEALHGWEARLGLLHLGWCLLCSGGCLHKVSLF